MKNISFTMICVLMQYMVYAQIENNVDSKISAVTVFLNKAQVTREVKTKVAAGKNTLVVKGLTSLLDQQSIQVSGRGKVVIEGIAHRQNFLSEFNLPPRLRLLKDSIDFMQRQVLFEQSQKEILTKEEQMMLSNQKIGGTQSNLTVAELKAMTDFFRSRLSEIVSARMKHDEKLKKLNEGIARLQRQLNEQNDIFSRNTSEIVIALSAETATPVELEINYIVSNAGWQPIYDLRALNTKSPIQLNYKANVFQNTGEEWNQVKITLSTANPSEGGLKPELYTWLLDFYYPRPAYVERKPTLSSKAAVRGMAESAPAEMTFESFDMVESDKASSFVNTTQTSLNTEFSIGLPYTVASANKPTMVDIRSHEMKATYTYSVAPKLDKDAFLMAKASGWEEFSLLPGEANIFFEGTFVGNSFIDPNSIKDTLSLSMGRDKRVVVKREKLKDFSSRKTIGANQRDSYAFEISIRNTKAEAIDLIVEDQIPVSKNSQIEVLVLDTGGASFNKETGKLEWNLKLQANETKKVQFKYEVKYPKDKQIIDLE